MRTPWARLAFGTFLAMALPAIAAMTGSGGEDTKPPQLPSELEKSQPAETPRVESISRGSGEKTLANGVYMSGQFTYALTGSTASITLERINNDSTSTTTGTLRLSLWATDYQPTRGDGITGYRLVDFSTLAPLAPRTYYYDIARSGTYVQPPNGTYWLVLVLSEYAPSSCPANADGYCLQDTFISFSQVRWGSVQPTFNYTDLWWTSTESGWGITLVQHPSNGLFAAWFTYDESGNPKWYVAPACQLVGDYCYGTLYETTGSPFSQPFNPAAVAARPVGTLSLAFSTYGDALMRYNVRGVIRTKEITRQPF